MAVKIPTSKPCSAPEEQPDHNLPCRLTCFANITHTECRPIKSYQILLKMVPITTFCILATISYQLQEINSALNTQKHLNAIAQKVFLGFV